MPGGTERRRMNRCLCVVRTRNENRPGDDCRGGSASGDAEPRRVALRSKKEFA